MFLCAELSPGGDCLDWVEYTSIFLLPEGAGLEIGGALLLTSITAWCVGLLVSFIRNR